MTSLQQLQALLSTSNLETQYVAAASDDADTEHLKLILEPGADGIDLLIDWLDAEPDGTGLLGLYADYPFQPDSLDAVPELMRLILWLNRFALIGHFGLQEDTGRIYFRYNLVSSARPEASSEAITEAVHMCAFFVRTNAPLLAQVAAGEASCEQVLEQLAEMAGSDQDSPIILQ